MKTNIILIAFFVALLSISACKHSNDQSTPNCPVEAPENQINAFSPNGDGRNDTYKILADSSHPITSMELHIFNSEDAEVATIFGKDGKWDGTDARTGRPCPPGRYRVEFGVVNGGYGQYAIAADGETYVFLFAGKGNCLVSQGCPLSSYTFEDQMAPNTLKRLFATGEKICN